LAWDSLTGSENSTDFRGFGLSAQAAAACPQRQAHAEHDRIHVVRTQSSSFRDAGLVPLICPTRQVVGKTFGHSGS
jgi:hypothetical protein